MSQDGKVSPPQYIVTTPSEVDADEVRSEQDLECGDAATVGEPSTTTRQRIFSQMETKMASRSFSIASSSSTVKSGSNSLDGTSSAALDSTVSTQQQQQVSSQVVHSQKIITTSTRSQSLQSAAVVSGDHSLLSQLGGSIGGVGAGSTAITQLGGQLKAQSSTSIVSSEQRSYIQKMASTTSSSSTKTNFKSFLQQPDTTGHPISSNSGSFLTAHQKHVRQFVRSTSAHSEATAHPISGSLGGQRPDKCIRSASTQIDETATAELTADAGMTKLSTSKLGLQQSSSILISKSAETIEMKTSSQSAGIRTQLTLSGGLLAPPNRKITILSPIHAPAGLHDLLKRSGRSPLSPRISFPGSEADLFG